MNTMTLVGFAAVGVLLGTAALIDHPDVTAPTSNPVAESGCQHPVQKPTRELYVRALYECTAPHSTLYVFDDTQARDGWWRIAKVVGGVETGRGSNWIMVQQ